MGDVGFALGIMAIFVNTGTLNIRESIEILERSEYRRFLADRIEAMIQFLEERERFEEIAAFERRLEELRAGEVAESAA